MYTPPSPQQLMNFLAFQLNKYVMQINLCFFLYIEKKTGINFRWIEQCRKILIYVHNTYHTPRTQTSIGTLITH